MKTKGILTVVTGATRGIGREIVFAFAEEGNDVAFCARREAEVKKMTRELKSKFPKQKFLGIPADMSVKDDIRMFADEITGNWKQVNVLVNNAGIFDPGFMSTEQEGSFEYMMQTNLFSAYHFTRMLLPHFSSKIKSHIINICSTASIRAYPSGGGYGVSKIALLGFSKNLREELKSQQIAVSAILPGATLTDSWSGSDYPKERFMTAKDVADVVIMCYRLAPRTVVEEVLMRPLKGDIA